MAQHASAEAQIASIADDIAYNTHDIDDGLRAGLFTLTDLKSIPVIAMILKDIDTQWPDLDASRKIHELGRRLITWLIEDVLRESLPFLVSLQSAAAVRTAGHSIIRFSEAGINADRALKNFLMPHMYRHKDVLRVRGEAERLVHDLFAHFMKQAEDLPEEWFVRVKNLEEPAKAREIADYIAGMTDRYALLEHQRLFDVTPELR